MMAAAKELLQSIRLSTSLIIMLGCRIFRDNSCNLLMCASKYLYELCSYKIGGAVKMPCVRDSSDSFLCYYALITSSKFNFCIRQIIICLVNQKGNNIQEAQNFFCLFLFLYTIYFYIAFTAKISVLLFKIGYNKNYISVGLAALKSSYLLRQNQIEKLF